MKKGLYISLIFFLLIIPIVSAEIEITLKKSSYQPRETLQVEIIGNFITLSKDNILIYKDNIPRSEPVISGLTRQDNKYYYYAILPNSEGNYSLRIENSLYSVSGTERSDTLYKNFTIIRTNQSALSINPGFIVTDKDFSIRVKSLYSTNNVYASWSWTSGSENQSIIEDEEKTFYFTIKNATTKSSFLRINDYSIPVFILKNPSSVDTGTLDNNIMFYPEELNLSGYSNRKIYSSFYIYNIGTNNLTNLSLSSNLDIIFSPRIFNLSSKDKKNISIIIDLSNSSDLTSGKIMLRSRSDNITLPIGLEILSNFSNSTINSSEQKLSCYDIGIICPYNQECSGEITASLEGPCCIGSCVEKKTTDYGLFIGIGLLILLAGGIFYFYWKSKKPKTKTTKDILEEKTKEFEERMKLPPPPKPTEVKDDLSKV